MKVILFLAVAWTWLVPLGGAQQESVQPQNRSAPEVHATPPSATEDSANADSVDIEQMRVDLQRLKTLVTQMRTNLAFVQTSQTPLKHQFELEADAWQVMVDQMERRLKRMEDRRGPGAAR